MNALHTFERTLPTPVVSPRYAPVASARTVHRPRATGIGYGSSSGYGRSRDYTAPTGPRLFRLV